MFKFEKMIAWQKGIEFVDQMFDLADQLPQRYQFSLGEQLRRAALSITNNLAEGSGRRTPALQRNFYDISKGSAYEVISILTIAHRRNHLTDQTLQSYYAKGDEIASIISGLIDATFREEQQNALSKRTLREEQGEYES
ncbi:MAG: four helix bundle protein [Anaerolineales bacterium]